MAYPRTTTRIIATAAMAAVVATPALATEGSGPPSSEALQVAAPGSPAALAVRQARLAEEARERRARAARERQQRAAARKERRNPGPFAPVVGQVDYGTAENAFGAARSGHIHSGHDIFAAPGTPLVAVVDGVVADAGSDGGQGNYLHLYDPRKDRTFVYMHMIEPSRFGPGEKVEAGEEVGGVGCTGSCSGDHLHFEIRDGKGFAGEARDPLPELEDWESLSKPA